MAATEQRRNYVKLRRALRIGLFGLLLYSPLPFGSVEPWAVLVVEVWAAVLGLGALSVLLLERRWPSRKVCASLLLASLVLLIGLLQVVPIPSHAVQSFLAPMTTARSEVVELLPELGHSPSTVSVSPAQTVDALLRYVAYVLIGFAAAVLIRTPSQLVLTAFCISSSGLIQAFYGSYEYLSGRQHIFGYAKQAYRHEATGTFINRNHFAGYLSMVLPLVLGLALKRHSPQKIRARWRDHALRFADPAVHVRVFAGLATLVIWTGVLLSRSRGGIAVGLLATLGSALYVSQSRRRTWLVAAAVLLPALYLIYADASHMPGGRFSDLARDLQPTSDRPVVWMTTAKMISDHPVLGMGFGTFEDAFPMYRPPSIRLHFDHAHSDWLQATAEGGVLTLMAFAAMLVLVVRANRRRFPVRSPSTTLGGCAAVGVAAVALHSLIDFELRIPANAILLACLAGLALVSSDFSADPD